MKLNKILITILLIPLFSSLKAQDNNIKLNLMSIPLGIAYPQYERVISPKLSVQLGFGFSPKKKIPQFTKNILDDYINDESDGSASESSMSVFFDKLRYTTIILTPEVRYFLGNKGAPRGVYLGAFLRYARHSGTSIYPHERDSGEIVDFDGELKSNAFGGGINLGIQWLIKDKISIDWNIIGIGINKSVIDLRIEGDNMTPKDVEDITAEIKDSYTGGDIFVLNLTAGDDYVHAVYTGLLPILRFGLSVGYAF